MRFPLHEIVKMDKLGEMCSKVLGVYEQEQDQRTGRDTRFHADRYEYKEKHLRRWLRKRFPMMTKELREDVCEYAVQNHAYERSDPRKYS